LGCMWSVVQIHSSRPYHIVALILLTNDDGIEAEGLQSLRLSLSDLAEVLVVAPNTERSAVSHGLTLRTPLKLEKFGDNQYTLNGTPADCVIHALSQVTALPPDLVISGINNGANLGDDIMYSGTVAAAREASRRGIRALAVSQAYDAETPINFKRGVRFMHALVARLLAPENNRALFLNINLPVRRFRGVKVTRQGCSAPYPHYNALDRVKREAGRSSEPAAGQLTDIPLDYHAVRNHYISVTPLQRDQTDYGMIDTLLKQAPKLFPARRIRGLGLIGQGF
jgi:5'-nucleotidase